MKIHNKNGDNVHMNFWTRKELEQLMLQSGFVKPFFMETKPFWKFLNYFFPVITNYQRHWLMIGGIKE